MKINLKSKKGFTTIDVTIAMIVVILFVSIMTSISYNVYLSSIEAKRTAVALNYAVDIFENIGTLSFDEVRPSVELIETESLMSMRKDLIIGTNSIEGTKDSYKIKVQIDDYMSANKVKIITVRIEYAVSKKKTDTVELQRLKVIGT